jgi:hypothetical protein
MAREATIEIGLADGRVARVTRSARKNVKVHWELRLASGGVLTSDGSDVPGFLTNTFKMGSIGDFSVSVVCSPPCKADGHARDWWDGLGRAWVGSSCLGGPAVGVLGLPGPRQQGFELMGFDVAGHDALEHILQVLERIEAIHLGALDQ